MRNFVRSIQFALFLALMSLSSSLSAQDSFWSMSNIAGTGEDGFVEGLDALATSFQIPGAMDVDNDGNIYFSCASSLDASEAGLFKIDHETNTIERLLNVQYISGIAVAPDGKIYFSKGGPAPFNFYIYCLTTDGLVENFAGNGLSGFPEEGAEASTTPIGYAGGIKIDPTGQFLYYSATSTFIGADETNYNFIQKIRLSDKITFRVAGEGGDPDPDDDDDELAHDAQLNLALGLAWDTAGNLYFATANDEIKKISDGIIKHVAGTGVAGHSGDGGPAAEAKIDIFNNGFVISDKNILFLTEAENFDIRRIELQPGTTLPEIITTICGSGYNEGDAANPSGDLENGFHKPAIEANIRPQDIYYLDGDLIITDLNKRLRRATICDNSVITITSTSNSAPCIGDSLKLSFFGELNDAEVWNWYKDGCQEGTSLGNGNALNIVVTGDESYFIIGTGNCVTNDECTEIKIEVACKDYFNTMTPNNDGFNDYFSIPLATNFPVNKVVLYNRWGDILETIENYDNTTKIWTGTNGNGDPVDSGTYFFTFEADGELKLSGWVELIK